MSTKILSTKRHESLSAANEHKKYCPRKDKKTLKTFVEFREDSWTKNYPRKNTNRTLKIFVWIREDSWTKISINHPTA